MLKRKDLAQEFSLIVKQEITNHNKAVLANNMAMNKLSQRLDQIETNIALLRGSLESQIQTERANRSKGEAKIPQYFEEIQRRADEISLRQNKFEEALINKLQEHLDIAAKATDLEKVHSKLMASLSSLKTSFKEIHSILIQTFKGLQSSVGHKISILENSIDKTYSANEKLRDELLELINKEAVNKQGILKEGEVLKKSLFIHEKKFENIYTLVSRLGEMVGSDT